MLDRRDLFHSALMGATAMVHPELATGEVSEPVPRGIVDTNVNVFQWPFRRLPLDRTDVLVRKLRSLRIDHAWVGSFEGLLHRDITAVNQRVFDECRQHPELTPIGSINPMLPDWQSDLKVCLQRFKMPAVRLHPNYHGYTLANRAFADVLRRVASLGRLVQLCVAMEDTRTHHPLVRVPDVDLSPLADVMAAIPQARVQLLNYRPGPSVPDSLVQIPGLYFDTARVEGTDGVASLLRSVKGERVMFGTHAPFLIPEASLIRVAEANLSDDAARALLGGTALGLVG
jgi:predicted TIM-barrel fold metal-dependent hydrolase